MAAFNDNPMQGAYTELRDFIDISYEEDLACDSFAEMQSRIDAYHRHNKEVSRRDKDYVPLDS